MFFTGIFSLSVLSVTEVWPAHKGLSFEKTACRVTHSEISCESGNCSCTSDGNVKEVPCLKVYVQCGGEDVREDEVIKEKFNFFTDKQHGHLLRKDVYHLDDKVRSFVLFFTYFLIVFLLNIFESKVKTSIHSCSLNVILSKVTLHFESLVKIWCAKPLSGTTSTKATQHVL